MPEEMKYCVICSKQVGAGKYDGIFCENDCGRLFCSDDCAQLESYENTFPNCCPGVYWCFLCKTEYLDLAKGHLFLIKNHPATPELIEQYGETHKNGAFIDRCMNCDMWGYEFKSQTNKPGKYEGFACEVWLENIE